MSLAPWEILIVDNTTEKIALELILKFRNHKAKYKNFDVDSAAYEFATTHKSEQWMWPKMDMTEITKLCRFRRHMLARVKWEEYKNQNN